MRETEQETAIAQWASVIEDILNWPKLDDDQVAEVTRLVHSMNYRKEMP